MTVKHKNEETHMLRKTGRRLAVARCPLYEQVRNVLVERLRHGDWHPGDRLPTESVLAEELGVSLGTLRRAVELLVEEGALIRRQGAGTFAATLATVAEENRFQPFESLDGSTRFDFRRLVLLEEAPCPAEAAAGLGIRACALRPRTRSSCCPNSSPDSRPSATAGATGPTTRSTGSMRAKWAW